MDMEMKLAAMDFSRFSKVKESLHGKLLREMRSELSFEDLDQVAAAGTSLAKKPADMPKGE